MRILYLSFYFEPDLSAGSFRNSSLAKELEKQFNDFGSIDLITTTPNRYHSYSSLAEKFEKIGSLSISRINIPYHNNGILDQIKSFEFYFNEVKRITSKRNYNLVFASSSRLFTAYLGYLIAKKKRIPLYLDIRDIFIDTLNSVIKNLIFRNAMLPFLRILENRTFKYATHINLISEGFKPYFSKYSKAKLSFYTNGVDDEFINCKSKLRLNKDRILIVYAGNIGEGQGLHKIIPEAASKLGDEYLFKLYGDGGAKLKLEKEIKNRNLTNVLLYNPISRDKLIEIYNDADFLMLHLNNYSAFKRVLPSKIFELAAFDKPIIAGVSGYSKDFIEKYISNYILFYPCDVESFVKQIKGYKYRNESRRSFSERFSRRKINKEMAQSIVSYIL